MSLPRFVVCIFLMVSSSSFVSAQEYPSKPIRIVTSAAGGGGDFTARLVAQGISSLGQPVIVDNRALTIMRTEIVMNAAPDGYNLLIAGGSFLTTPLLQKVSYDIAKDFSPISLIEMSTNIVAVHPSLAAKSIKDLIALAKARPGELNYASTGVGGVAHLAGELFKSMAGVNITNVPYKGASPALNGLLAGDVQLTLSSVASVAPHIKSGRLRALAVTSAQPSALAPGLPTVAATVPGYEAVSMTGIYARAKTPASIIKRLNQEIARFVNRADVKEKFLAAGVEPVGNSPEEFAVKVQSEIARMGKVIKDANITLD